MLNGEALLRQLSRDLSILTSDEMLLAWGEKEREAVAHIAKATKTADPFATIEKHNPIYYLAQKCFFDGTDLLYAPFHRDMICKQVLDYAISEEVTDSGLLLLAQRDSFKSTFMHGAVPLWVSLRWKEMKRKNVRIALLHQKELQASSNAVRLKGKSNHPWMKDVWPEFTAEKDFGDKTKFRWPCAQGHGASEPSVMAAGLGQDLTGWHFDFMFLSDLVTKEDCDSVIVRKNTEDCYEALRYTLDTMHSRVFLDGTRYHIRDLYGKLISLQVREKNAYRSIVLGAGGKHTGTPLTFPTRHSQEYLDRRREEELGQTGRDLMYWLQMQNQVRNPYTSATDPLWLKHCKQADVPDDVWRCVTIDPAWKGMPNQGKGDFASIQVWGFEKRGNLVLKYLIDGIHSNTLSDADGKSHIFRFMNQYGVVDVAPEERGGHAFRQSLRNEAVSRGVLINVIDLKTMQVGKPQRITAFIGKCQSGTVFICDECDPSLKNALESEFADYPQVDHDDALDAAAYTDDPAIAEAFVPRFGSVVSRWRKDRLQQGEPARTRYCSL